MTIEDVQHKEASLQGRFYLEERCTNAAVLTYLIDKDVMVIEHTAVSKEYEGKGLGKLLVQAALTFARSRRLKVLPQCPYARKVMEKSPEYQDLLV